MMLDYQALKTNAPEEYKSKAAKLREQAKNESDPVTAAILKGESDVYEKASTLKSDRVVNGVTIPVGYDFVTIPVGIDGSMMQSRKHIDRYGSESYALTLPDGTMRSFTPSRSKKPETQRQHALRNGFQLVTVIAPVTLEAEGESEKVVIENPDWEAVAEGHKLMTLTGTILD